MKERIKTLRKYLNLTQEEFSKKIGIKRNTLANYEIGRNEPIDGIIFSICREFNVSEVWLRDGIGEMLIELPAEDEYFKAATLLSTNKDERAMNAVIEYWKLDDASKEAIWSFISKLAKK